MADSFLMGDDGLALDFDDDKTALDRFLEKAQSGISGVLCDLLCNRLSLPSCTVLLLIKFLC